MKHDIEEIVAGFQEKALPNHRYSSFDYCYNYFYKISNKNIDTEKSCAFLGFYLASWGMFRGSSFLLQKSYKYFMPLVDYINGLDESIWDISPIDYLTTKKQKQIINIYTDIRRLVIENFNQSKTLVTKIMLGTLGIVPAYDEYFCNTFKDINPSKSKFSVFNENSLVVLGDFYLENRTVIDRLSEKIKTKKFEDDSDYLNYPTAKIIDMYGFAKSMGN